MSNINELVSQVEWQNVTGSIWFYLLSSILVAVITGSITYYYSIWEKKHKQINLILSKIFSSGRRLRAAYLDFAENDDDFLQQQKKLYISRKNKDEKQAEIHKEAAFIAQNNARDSLQEITKSRIEFLEAAYKINALLNLRIQKTNFMQLVEKVSYFSVAGEDDLITIKSKVDNNLTKNISELEQICGRILWERNANWIEKILDKVFFWKKENDN
jgi:hypothetical protein